MPEKTYQVLITRLPYARTAKHRFNAKPLIQAAKKIDPRGLICIAMPIHVENPNNGGRLICELEDAGLICVAKIAWFRDRHVVTTKSKRVTNSWEPIAIFSQSKSYVLNREAATKIKRGYEGRETNFDDEDYLTCLGDHWPIRNDRRDRRFLPATIVLNCGQLADLRAGDSVYDPYGNPGIKDACDALGWTYVDGGMPNEARNPQKQNEKEIVDEKELLRLRTNEQTDSEVY